MEIIQNIEQGSDEWRFLRIGSVGGSSISSAVAGGQGKTRKQLMYRLAGEILSGEKYEGYSNSHMERGVALEDEARQHYAFIENVTVEQVAMFRYADHKHFSPDGDLKSGIIEIKCTIPSVHIETIISNKVPAAYRKQCQWGMMERDWCDFISYSPAVRDCPLWVKRIYHDDKLNRKLNDGADIFIDEMLEIVRKIRNT